MINKAEKRSIYIPCSWCEEMEERNREEDGDVDANAMEGLRRLRDSETVLRRDKSMRFGRFLHVE